MLIKGIYSIDVDGWEKLGVYSWNNDIVECLPNDPFLCCGYGAAGCSRSVDAREANAKAAVKILESMLIGEGIGEVWR